MRSGIAVLAVAAALVSTAHAAVEADKITEVPGAPWYPNSNLESYSGYVDIDSPYGGKKHYHYYLTMSENDPKTDPVVLWLQGGPGCSSLAGAMIEGGPLHFNQSNAPYDVVLNPYRWSKKSTVIYLESPAGVGFSYADSKDGYHYNDSVAAEENYMAVSTLLGSNYYPELNQGQKFAITGESYGGIYIPTLAQQIVEHNKLADADTKINLGGIEVGNGCLGNDVGVCGGSLQAAMLQFFSQGLIEISDWNDVVKTCGEPNSWNQTGACNDLCNKLMNNIGPLDIYDLQESCDPDSVTTTSALSWLPHVSANLREGPDGCLPGPKASITLFFNDKDVRKAFHVDTYPGGEWAICGCADCDWSYNPTQSDERKKVYPDILDSGAVVFITNGDADGCVPWTDNQQLLGVEFATSRFGNPTSSWAPWFTDDKQTQVGGYEMNWGKDSSKPQMYYVSVHGAGHLIPQTKPVAAEIMYNKFLAAL